MGHERIGFLPRTQPWNAIVNQLSQFGEGNISAVQIANSTLDAIKRAYETMPFDDSVIKALLFLSTLSYSAKNEDQVAFLNDNGCAVDSQMSLFSLMLSAQAYITTETGSLEINKLAKDAAMQAIIEYQQKHKTGQITMFGEESKSVWSSVGTGAAFSEMARSFFSSFTDRQLRYYIERAAASSINNYETLQMFNHHLSAQTKTITDHTFEVAKLTQSFAAGWYNKNVTHSLPDKKQVEAFLRMSFSKLREEFRREADGK